VVLSSTFDGHESEGSNNQQDCRFLAPTANAQGEMASLGGGRKPRTNTPRFYASTQHIAIHCLPHYIQIVCWNATAVMWFSALSYRWGSKWFCVNLRGLPDCQLLYHITIPLKKLCGVVGEGARDSPPLGTAQYHS